MTEDLFLALLGTTIFWFGCVIGYVVGYRGAMHYATAKVDEIVDEVRGMAERQGNGQ